jgi:hypothetical protein
MDWNVGSAAARGKGQGKPTKAKATCGKKPSRKRSNSRGKPIEAKESQPFLREGRLFPGRKGETCVE